MFLQYCFVCDLLSCSLPVVLVRVLLAWISHFKRSSIQVPRNFECVTRGISILFNVILNMRRVFLCPWNSKYELLPTFSVRRLALNQSWTIVNSLSMQYEYILRYSGLDASH